jgi:hypothetical protein
VTQITKEQVELAQSVLDDSVMDFFGRDQKKALQALIFIGERIASGEAKLMSRNPSRNMIKAGFNLSIALPGEVFRAMWNAAK